ncbi:hypothetical protein [Microbulbifer taiwanensis]|uniref:hypothetical protein n=1 Tax=Microbulbifer taiwanensis TaxID=986746 RepID=UPI003615B9F6
MRTKTLFGALLAGVLVACATTSPAPIPSANSENIRRHVEILAADELAGRETGSAGYREAADYVAGQFEQMGLQPAGSQRYLQQVPFVRASWEGANRPWCCRAATATSLSSSARTLSPRRPPSARTRSPAPTWCLSASV